MTTVPWGCHYTTASNIDAGASPRVDVEQWLKRVRAVWGRALGPAVPSDSPLSKLGQGHAAQVTSCAITFQDFGTPSVLRSLITILEKKGGET